MVRALASGVLLVSLMPVFSCAGKKPSNLGVSGGSLAACPGSPNCVSSDATDVGQRVEPLRLAVDRGEAWRAIREVVAGLPRTQIVTEGDDYLHAECRSRILGFVDDLELQLRPGQGLVAVRSASRVGYSDLGVNRARVEELRGLLGARGVVER